MDRGMLHYLAALEQQIVAHECMLRDLFEIDALLEPLLAGNLLDFPIMKLHDYLNLISRAVARLIKTTEQLLSLLIKIKEENLSK